MVISSLDEMERFESRIKYSYNKICFHRINEEKVERVVAFWYGAPKEKACVIGGIQNERLLFPYSSPYTMVETFKHCRNEDYERVANEIDDFCRGNSIKETYIVFPPIIYDETNITKCVSAFLREGYEVYEMGLNYQIEIGNEDEYKSRLLYNGRKNLKHATGQNYLLSHCETEEEKIEAYSIIEVNRKSKGYSLSMTWEEVNRTTKLMENDFFVLRLDGKSVASAIVFGVTQSIRQVVYWGDVPGHENERPMNYLPYALHRYYSTQKGVRLLDIGPSMLDGKPNYSLCDYKESIGCSVSGKFVLRREY